MQSLIEFLHMGGYGEYVWSALSICFITLAINFYLPLRDERRLLRKLHLLASRELQSK